MRIKFTTSNTRLFSASFYDTLCTGCETHINEGDPTGWILPDKDLYCLDCLNKYGKRAHIEIKQ